MTYEDAFEAAWMSKADVPKPRPYGTFLVRTCEAHAPSIAGVVDLAKLCGAVIPHGKRFTKKRFCSFRCRRRAIGLRYARKLVAGIIEAERVE